MKNAAILNKKSPPYLFDRYNVAAYFNTSSSPVKGLACMINPLVEALNERQKLPRFLIIIPDKDIVSITEREYSNSGTYMIGAALHYITKQMDILIE